MSVLCGVPMCECCLMLSFPGLHCHLKIFVLKVFNLIFKKKNKNTKNGYLFGKGFFFFFIPHLADRPNWLITHCEMRESAKAGLRICLEINLFALCSHSFIRTEYLLLLLLNTTTTNVFPRIYGWAVKLTQGAEIENKGWIDTTPSCPIPILQLWVPADTIINLIHSFTLQYAAIA